jgi:hypothetical protein
MKSSLALFAMVQDQVERVLVNGSVRWYRQNQKKDTLF